MTQKEKFIQEGKIEITAHPITGVRRTAKLLNFTWRPGQKVISLEYEIAYLDADGETYNLLSMPGYFKPLVASGDEYDGIVATCNNEINVFDLMIELTLQRAQEGKFDI